MSDTSEGQLIAMFDALGEWFSEADYKGCLFIKASSEYQEPSNPTHKQSADHKRMLEKHITELAKKAGLLNPEFVARQLLFKRRRYCDGSFGAY